MVNGDSASDCRAVLGHARQSALGPTFFCIGGLVERKYLAEERDRLLYENMAKFREMHHSHVPSAHYQRRARAIAAKEEANNFEMAFIAIILGRRPHLADFVEP